MATFSIINLGCKVNRAESDLVETLLLKRGLSPSDANCDFVLINTCTVTSVAEKKTRKAVRQALNANPVAKVVVTGCAAAQDKHVYLDMSDRVEVVQKWDLDSYLSGLFDADSIISTTCAPGVSENVSDGRYCRANVKVQDGCVNECAYCIIHKLRGPEISIDPKIALDRTIELVDLGISEVILSGINLGRYDFEGATLSKLCEILLGGEDRCRFRLSSIEPDNLTEDVIDLVASADGRICRHFHLPLQSGCDRTLVKMNRKYDTSFFRTVISDIKDKIPNASISTDVICGFPGETDSDFRETVRFCEEIGFSKMHVFPFSPRKGTPAFDMDDQIDHFAKMERARELREVAKVLRAKDLEGRRGSIEQAVVEDDEWCMSESYHRVASPADSKPGEMVEVSL